MSISIIKLKEISDLKKYTLSNMAFSYGYGKNGQFFDIPEIMANLDKIEHFYCHTADSQKWIIFNWDYIIGMDEETLKTIVILDMDTDYFDKLKKIDNILYDTCQFCFTYHSEKFIVDSDDVVICSDGLLIWDMAYFDYDAIMVNWAY